MGRAITNGEDEIRIVLAREKYIILFLYPHENVYKVDQLPWTLKLPRFSTLEARVKKSNGTLDVRLFEAHLSPEMARLNNLQVHQFLLINNESPQFPVLLQNHLPNRVELSYE